VLTQDVQATGGGSDGQPLRASETIIRNIRVLATDQRYDNQPTAEGKSDVHNFSMVTVEATPKMAEKIAVSQKLGALSLSLRPLADNTQELEQEIAAGDINVPANTDPKAEKKMLLDLASRPQDTKTTFTTGGEVSRFARTSIPKVQVASAAPAAPAAGGAQVAAPAYLGPIVRVARGNNVTVTSVGGK
jgi:pilus assembly protein CpaB